MRKPLPNHLLRVAYRHEPEEVICRSPGCGNPMTRIREAVSEGSGYGSSRVRHATTNLWEGAFHGCQSLIQVAAVTEVIDGGTLAAGSVAHTLISRFVDHALYYRQESINACSKVHDVRWTLKRWSGQRVTTQKSLFIVRKRFVLCSWVLDADGTPLAMPDPGADTTGQACV